MRRALISVYDKTGLDTLAAGLHECGVELVSTGGSAAAIEALRLPVTRVEELTGFPECLEGRVKTLHPKVHAGLLADTRETEHLQQLSDLGVDPFELVVCNLYPFSATVASGAGPDECVEQIDIGGPTMVRAAAKNHESVAIVTDPATYPSVLDAVRGGGFTLDQRRELALAAFVHTAEYDVAVASWMGTVWSDPAATGGESTAFPAWLGGTWRRAQVLRYGENAHQRAALYTTTSSGAGAVTSGAVTAGAGTSGLAQATQLHGKEMSYNNYLDADAAYRAAYDHGDRPTCAIIKHANPCGIAVADDIATAHRKAHECDPVSAYGGIIATNREVTAELAESVKDIFTEVVVAPSYEPEALALLTQKKNIRLLTVPPPVRGGLETRPVSGGLLVQERDLIDAVVAPVDGEPPTAGHGDDPSRWTLVAGPAADEATLADLQFAWRAIRAAKSNAILLARDGASVGVGMGQVNRVDSCHLAVNRAGADRARGAVAASDAFFPFADGPQVLIDAGVRAMVAPGGSIRDQDTIDLARERDITLYFTGTRHFAH